jgi:hypothetical protein
LIRWDSSQPLDESVITTHSETQTDPDRELRGRVFFAHGMVSLHKGAVDGVGEGRVRDVRRATGGVGRRCPSDSSRIGEGLRMAVRRNRHSRVVADLEVTAPQ